LYPGGASNVLNLGGQQKVVGLYNTGLNGAQIVQSSTIIPNILTQVSIKDVSQMRVVAGGIRLLKTSQTQNEFGQVRVYYNNRGLWP